MSARRALLPLAIGSLAVSAAVAILVLLFGEFGETETRILGTTFAISVASLLALPGSILLERGERTMLGGANVVLAAASFVVALALLWVWDDSETLAKLLGTLVAFAVASTQIAGSTLRVRPTDASNVRIVYVVAATLAVVLAILVTVLIWLEVEDETYLRTLAALAVLDVFLVVLQPLLRRLGGGARAAAAVRLVVEGATADAVADAVRRLEAAGARVRVER